jgi:hypothetical protein
MTTYGVFSLCIFPASLFHGDAGSPNGLFSAAFVIALGAS